MEIALKGLFGAIVAIAMHYAANSKHSYLAGLIPSIPIFALFAHAMFASSGRSLELQGAAHFGLVTIVPFVLYLFFVWWLSTKVNMWVALVLALAVWCITTLIAFAFWHRNELSITTLLNTRFATAIIASTLVCSFLATVKRLYEPGTNGTELVSSSWRDIVRRRLLDKSLAGFAVLLIGSSYLLTSPVQLNAGRLPGEDRICGLLQTALVLGPSGVNAQQIQHSALASYVTLAKNATLSGNDLLANQYSGRARAVLFGSWIDAAEHKPKFC